MDERLEVVLSPMTWDQSSETYAGFKRRVIAEVDATVRECEDRAYDNSMAGRRANAARFEVAGRIIYRPVGLTEKQWSRFERVIIDGRTFKDVAQEDEVATGNVANRVQQALAAIVEDLLARGEPVEEVGKTLLSIGKHVQVDVWRGLAKIDQSIFPGASFYRNRYGTMLESVRWGANDYVESFRRYLAWEEDDAA